MKFAIISPIAGLRRFSSLSPVQMALAQFVNSGHYERYVRYFLEMKERGDFIILDNGVYEGERLPKGELWEAIMQLKPNVAILPDHLLQDWRLTVSSSLRFLDCASQGMDEGTFNAIEWMFVPQAVPMDVFSIFRGVEAILNDSRWGHKITWIGLPRALHTHFGQMRVRVAMELKRLFPHLHLHALGSGAGSIQEFKLLEAVGVETLDSSTPVWRGWNGVRMGEEWADIPVDFHAPLIISEEKEGIIIDNLTHFGIGGGDE